MASAAITPRTELDADLLRIRRRGYALDNEEHEEGVSCVASAVFDATGAPAAAISISGPTPRIARATAAELGALLKRHASDVSELLRAGDSTGSAAVA